MQYFGGKNRSGKRIATILNNIIKEKEIENYVELFLGSGGYSSILNAKIR